MGNHINETLDKEPEPDRAALRDLLWSHAASTFEELSGTQLRHMYKAWKKTEQPKPQPDSAAQ